MAAASQRAAWLSLCPDPNLDPRRPDAVPAPRATRPSRLARRAPAAPRALALALLPRAARDRARRGHSSSTTRRAAHTSTWSTTWRTSATAIRASSRAGARQMAVLNTNTRYLHPVDRPLRRAADGDAARAALGLLLRLLGQRGQRARAAPGARAHGGARRRRRGRRVPRQHAGARGRQPVQVRRARAATGAPAVGPQGPDAGRLPRALPARRPRARREVRRATCGEAAGGSRDRRRAGRRFLCESLLSCGGQIVLPPGYLAAAYRHARAAGAVCIADEVQVGLRPRRLALLGLRDAGRRARHRHDGQADRQRPSARRGRHDAGDRRRRSPTAWSTSTPSAATPSPARSASRCST